MQEKKFQAFVILGIAWVIAFLLMLITKLPTARGVLALISVVCVLWFAYWTIVIIRGTDTEKETNADNKKKDSAE